MQRLSERLDELKGSSACALATAKTACSGSGSYWAGLLVASRRKLASRLSAAIDGGHALPRLGQMAPVSTGVTV